MKKKAHLVYFGAAGSGMAYCRHTSSVPDFFVDNDPGKLGSILEGAEVKSPDILAKVEIEKVVITSGYMKDIYRQLLTLGIPESKIQVPPKSLIGFHCFDSHGQRVHAAETLSLWMSKFDLVAVGGTALGFVRDHDFIQWDNDIDLFAPKRSRMEIIDFFNSNGFDFQIEETSATKSIKSCIRREGEIEIPFSIDFFDSEQPKFLDLFEDYSWEWPTRMFTDFEVRNVHGFNVNVPKPPELYLKQVYGKSWNHPKPDFGYDEYRGSFNETGLR